MGLRILTAGLRQNLRLIGPPAYYSQIRTAHRQHVRVMDLPFRQNLRVIGPPSESESKRPAVFDGGRITLVLTETGRDPQSEVVSHRPAVLSEFESNRPAVRIIL